MGNCCSYNPVKYVENRDYTDAEAREHALEVGVNPRPQETSDEISAKGAFVRQPNAFIKKFGVKTEDLKAEANKYAIYWAHGCHWSNRPVIVRDILGLTDVIKDTAVTHTGENNEYGWGFSDQPNHRDVHSGAYFLSQFYKNANPEFKGRATTPSFVDLQERKTVNNDYHRLTNYIEVFFRPFQPVDAPDLYPVSIRKEIDRFNDWLFPNVNNAHYRMAFCQSWEAYEEAYNDFYNSLDYLEERLSKNRFLFGDYITDSDIRLYVTLVRWETSYYANVGPMKKRITEYKNIWGYVRELYAIPEFKKYTFFEFPESAPGFFKPYSVRIAKKVPYDKLWASDGSRKTLSKTPNEIYLRHPANESYEEYITEISDCIWNSSKEEDRDPSINIITI